MMEETKISATLPVPMALKNTNIMAPAPSAPPMKTGLRPILSASIPYSGWVSTAVKFATAIARSMVVRSMPLCSTA